MFMTLMIEAVHTSETSVYSNETTRRYIPGGSDVHTVYHENLKSHRNKYIIWLGNVARGRFEDRSIILKVILENGVRI
jgi:hypothetical protein